MARSFQLLKQEIQDCRECRRLFGFEPNPIFWGNAGAKIFHISQAPSRTVHQTGKPFNDLSGKRLREWYGVSEEEFYNGDNFYISAVAHCFPGKAKRGGDIKAPVICAERWLRREMDVVDNEIYIIVGRQAARFFYPEKEYTDLVFEGQELNGKPAYVLPHPSPLNAKWFKDHPDFLRKRVKEIRQIIHGLI